MSLPKVRSPFVSRRAVARLGALLLLVLVAAALSGCKERHKALELYREGYRVFRFELDPERAEGILLKALEVDPTLTQAHVELADLYMFEGIKGAKSFSPSKAELHLRETLRLAPDHVYAHYWLGRAAYRKGAFDEALREFDTTIKLIEWPFGSELGGDWKQLYLYKSYILLDAGQYAKAEANLKKFNSFSHDKYYYFAGMVLAAEGKGDHSQAEAFSSKMFEKYVLVEPAAYRGLVEMFRGRPERAGEIFTERLKKLDAPHALPGGELDNKTLYLRDFYRRLLAWAHMKAGRAEEAEGSDVGKKADQPLSTLEVLKIAAFGSSFGDS